MATADAGKTEKIRGYIIRERKRRGIKKLGTERLPELSCEMFGEFYNLIERQLMATHEGYGAWSELRDPAVLDGAYKYAKERQRG